MASTLSFSELNKVENFTTNKPKKNKTIKKRSKKVRDFLNSMNDEESLDDSGLANFEPLAPGTLTKQPVDKKEEKIDAAIGVEAFSKLDVNQVKNDNYENYYNKYIPYYTQPTNNANIHGSKDELMKKLNYMIHLLEENKDEKKQNVTEELVLYMFLCVFTIFVVDSFARAGKYTR